ncbi:hypothetical protein EDD53_1092 [Pacificibacter maritimus]|uniref:Uncharacterized protein n=1 Tax=Pacificibacter maritimus TaxID=762213 RepID=A0A3N4V4A6_9RHOB|nr:hypothetical protein EDD53_1092 [Pacificibacter maritimus]
MEHALSPSMSLVPNFARAFPLVRAFFCLNHYNTHITGVFSHL